MISIKKLFIIVLIISLSFLHACKKIGRAPSYYTYHDLLDISENYRGHFNTNTFDYFSENEDVYDILPPMVASTVYQQDRTIKEASKHGIRFRLQTRPDYLKPNYYQNKRGTTQTKRMRTLDSHSRSLNPSSSQVRQFIFDGKVEIDWNNGLIMPGDLLFIRGVSINSKFISHFFSSWSHVAFVWNTYHHEVLDSIPNGGVKVRNIHTEWKPLTAYGVKTLKKVPYFTSVQYDSSGRVIQHSTGSDDSYKLMTMAHTKYLNRPYWPKHVDKNKNSKLSFFKKWSHKFDSSSMYCSKFVYHAVKDYNSSIDLDSNITQTTLKGLKDPDSVSYDHYTSYPWMGISPDDIWASNETMPYWIIEAPENLWEVLDH